MWLWIAVVVCSLCSVAAVVWSGSGDGFEKPRDTETAISLLENEMMASSSASQVPMVPLTLIQGADSKGAGTFLSLSLSLSLLFVFPLGFREMLANKCFHCHVYLLVSILKFEIVELDFACRSIS